MTLAISKIENHLQVTSESDESCMYKLRYAAVLTEALRVQIIYLNINLLRITPNCSPMCS